MAEDILFCRGGGCTAKLGPAVLSHILAQLPRAEDPNLLVGYASSDDAAVYRLGDDLAIVQTLDFFPPMVEDPYTFGQIAAANALSDIYAMGAVVKTALNIVCFPEEMDMNILGKILQGGADKVLEAGGSLCGGHSINDKEIKYGLAVTGVIHPERILANNSCRAGDYLILTKALGTGIICTAARVNDVSEASYKAAVQSMCTLNRRAAEAAAAFSVHACTDVTGFGFLGHLNEMLDADFSAEIYADRLPLLPDVRHYIEEFYLTAAAQRNRNHLAGELVFSESDFATEELLFDPQTSGGLLFSVAAPDKDVLLHLLRDLALPAAVVGQVTTRQAKKIYVQGCMARLS